MLKVKVRERIVLKEGKGKKYTKQGEEGDKK